VTLGKPAQGSSRRRAKARRRTRHSATRSPGARASRKRRARSGRSCAHGRPSARWSRARTNRGRARETFRLQKSTDDVRPTITLRRRAVGTEGGSSPAARERIARRKDAGSRLAVAKLRDRWRASRILHTSGIRGFLPGNRGRPLRGAFVDGRRSGSKKRRALTSSAWERSSAPREMRPARSRSARAARQGTSEAARQPRTWSITPR